MCPKSATQPLTHGITRAADGKRLLELTYLHWEVTAPTSLLRPTDTEQINFFLESFDILIYKYDAIFWMK